MKPLNRLYSICEKHDLALVYLFGSQAQAGNKLLQGLKVMVEDHLTDLDVGVVTTKPLPASDKRVRFYSTLYNDMEDLFKPYRLDLVLLEENHSVFQFEAIKGICVYEANSVRREEYEMMVLRHAADFRPFLEKYLEESLEEV